ncbi:MAG: hypothetical protein QNJ16_21940 [Rhodobacter sp.]|nr:hypothetical protein [Gammaproteobacteria bacterium]MDJ0828146.1 hypothetical protein [Rhodobacter sp.]
MTSTQDYDDFIAWQCRLRKHSMRELGGRPTTGMSAGIHSVNGGDEQARLSFLILHRDPAERTAEFSHIVRKTQDPTQWIKNGLRILAERHYQDAEPFDRRLTALFSLDSSVAYALLKAGACHLKFSEKSIGHAFDFDVESLDRDDPLFAATYWHNHLFNPTLPGQVRVLAFTPRL